MLNRLLIVGVVLSVLAAPLLRQGPSLRADDADKDSPAPAPAEPNRKLQVGDPAPPLHVSKWINGKAVEKFEKGKVYVIECWATWCPPCRAAIPHVSAMNTKFKDKGVVFIGLNVWERDQSGVEPFVKDQGERMNYVVAIDQVEGRTGKSAEAWLTAAGKNGIPCTFVVDKASKVAWIGHPMAGLDRVVAGVVDGTFDSKKEAERAARLEAINEKLNAAAQVKDWDTVLKLFDELATLRPELKDRVPMIKVAILLIEKQDFKAGYAQLEKLADNQIKDNAEALNELAWMVLSDRRLKQRNYDLALKMAKRAAELTKNENAAMLDTLARAHFEKGQFDQAIAAQKLAITKADEDDQEQMKASLAKYEAAKKGQKEKE